MSLDASSGLRKEVAKEQDDLYGPDGTSGVVADVTRMKEKIGDSDVLAMGKNVDKMIQDLYGADGTRGVVDDVATIRGELAAADFATISDDLARMKTQLGAADISALTSDVAKLKTQLGTTDIAGMASDLAGLKVALGSVDGKAGLAYAVYEQQQLTGKLVTNSGDQTLIDQFNTMPIIQIHAFLP